MSKPRTLLCGNGHKQPASADRFCIYCGLELTAAPAAGVGNETALQPQTPAQATPRPTSSQPAPHLNHQQVQQRQPPYVQPPPPKPKVNCNTCGGFGEGLKPNAIICEECSWLRPLVPGYQLDNSAFAWAADAKAMSVLRSIKPLNAAAKVVSEKVGRRWIESTFNSVLLSEKQVPQIYAPAVRAARILGMSHMPDVYLSGERSWDCLTFGTDKDSFVVIGSALAGSFRGAEMLFLLAREMGHCRAGHALWKSVIRFFLGEQGPSRGFMAGGILNAVMSPTALIGGALEVPLLAWARQAEITADRAGLVAVGDEQVARRVLLTWTLKSPMMYRQINIDAWLEQQSEDDDNYSKLSELTTTSTPYITPRLRLLTEFAQSQELRYWRNMIETAISTGRPKLPPKPAAQKLAAQKPTPPKSPATEVVKLKCATCQTPMRVPQAVLAGKTELPVKCPNPECGKITRLKKKARQPGNVATAQKPE